MKRRVPNFALMAILALVPACTMRPVRMDEVNGSHGKPSMRFQGLRTAVYAAPDLDKAKAWYTEVLGFAPYFDEPFYVGFNVGGYELALDPDGKVGEGVAVYWGVEDIETEYERLLELGARPSKPIQEVGGELKVATVLDPFGNPFGIIYNPHFKLP